MHAHALQGSADDGAQGQHARPSPADPPLEQDPDGRQAAVTCWVTGQHVEVGGNMQLLYALCVRLYPHEHGSPIKPGAKQMRMLLLCMVLSNLALASPHLVPFLV